jgi:hypothetical protein
MQRKLALLFLSIALCYPAFASSGGHHSSSTSAKAAKSDTSKPVHVRGYTKKDGTYVAPYDRGTSATTERASTRAYRAPTTFSSGHVAEGYTADSSVRVNSHGKIKRSGAAKDAFKRQQPCPSTGKGSGSCPGYVIDHVNPLECGGADAPTNMQWQTVADGKAKDKTERLCRN